MSSFLRKPGSWLALSVLAFILTFVLVETSEAQRWGGGGGYRPSYGSMSARSSAPRAMQPRQVSPSFNRAARPTASGRASGSFNRSARPLPPSVRANSSVARMASYSGRVSRSGSPIVTSRAGRPYAIPQQAMFSSRMSLMSGTSRTALTSRMGTRVADVKKAHVSVAKASGVWERKPKSIQDQMTLKAAREGAGERIKSGLGDPRYKGMEKWEYRVKSKDKNDSVVHYVRDPATGRTMDFKFTKSSVENRLEFVPIPR